jgi:hypothetical protein
MQRGKSRGPEVHRSAPEPSSLIARERDARTGRPSTFDRGDKDRRRSTETARHIGTPRRATRGRVAVIAAAFAGLAVVVGAIVVLAGGRKSGDAGQVGADQPDRPGGASVTAPAAAPQPLPTSITTMSDRTSSPAATASPTIAPTTALPPRLLRPTQLLRRRRRRCHPPSTRNGSSATGPRTPTPGW